MLPFGFVTNVVFVIMILAMLSLAGFVLTVPKRRTGTRDYFEQSVSSKVSQQVVHERTLRQISKLKRVFLHQYPEWEGRDFLSDHNSPWYSDSRFNNSINWEAPKSNVSNEGFGPSNDPVKALEEWSA
jgi:hypothetical protein